MGGSGDKVEETSKQTGTPSARAQVSLGFSVFSWCQIYAGSSRDKGMRPSSPSSPISF